MNEWMDRTEKLFLQVSVQCVAAFSTGTCRNVGFGSVINGDKNLKAGKVHSLEFTSKHFYALK